MFIILGAIFFAGGLTFAGHFIAMIIETRNRISRQPGMPEGIKPAREFYRMVFLGGLFCSFGILFLFFGAIKFLI